MYRVSKSFIPIFILFLLTGCGYRPSSEYTKRVLGDKIYTKVYIDIKDPENSVLIKDAINEAIISKFRSKIVDNIQEANSSFYIKFKSKSFTPVAYDKNGYVVAYKTKVSLNISFVGKNGQKNSFNVSGTYNFPIEANSVISDTKRFEAIKFASYKAISEFVSKVAVSGINSKDDVGSMSKSEIYLK